jgi:SAM-dependent methyltransferase
MPRPDPGPDNQMNTPSHDCAGTILLSDLCLWREQLARSIARNNIGLRSNEIALATHRILFQFCILALAEDRGLVTHGTLLQIASAEISDVRLGEFFTGMIDPWAGTGEDKETYNRYNSVPGKRPVIDDEIIRNIATRLASADRPYHFSRISLEEIACVFDQYLNRTIRRSAAHQAVVVDRQERSVGVVPNPFFLDYAVSSTLAAALVSRSYEEPLPLRILDPSCGAGSLLLRAYNRLVNGKNQTRWTFVERKELLEHTLFGLDIDPHAVAVSRILLAFVVYGYDNTMGLQGGFFEIFGDLLYTLSSTIRCGNALVSPEIAEDESWAFCPAHERHAIQMFDWQEDFFEILAPGGFDVVLCCPPENLVPVHEWLQRYFQRHYSVYDSGAKISAFFIEKACRLLRPRGITCFVTGTWWLNTKAGVPLRELLLAYQIEEIRFSSNKGDTACFLRFTNGDPTHPFLAQYGDSFLKGDQAFPVNQHELSAGGWHFCDTREERLLEKISRAGTPLEISVLGGVQYRHATELTEARAKKTHGKDTEQEEKPQIIFSFEAFPPCFTLGKSPKAVGTHFGIIPSGSRFLLGLLNSRLAAFVFTHLAESEPGDEYPGDIVGQFPVYIPDLDDAMDKARYDRLEKLVTEMRDLHRHLSHATTEREKQLIAREIDSTDKQINSLVYGIYGLSVIDIAVVESRQFRS